ncbi:MAG: DUF1028 domain-containing protein [Candidatus Obscuribacterales bacterium]|nr:DUF1028 domain-containing protein [Candidatus Obscuribacterales bacterium]
MTFTIVAMDEEKKLLGLASASCGLFSGNLLPLYGCLGNYLGAVQAYPSMKLKRRLVDYLSKDGSLETLAGSLEALDPHIQYRQIGVLDRLGNRFVYSGDRVSTSAGHLLGANYLIVGNMLERTECLQAMADTFEAEADAALAYRLIKALEACKKAGGQKIGGKPLKDRTAVLLVIGEDNYPSIDLRVNMSENAVEDLRRQYVTYKIYDGFLSTCETDPEKLPALSAQESLMPFAPDIFRVDKENS